MSDNGILLQFKPQSVNPKDTSKVYFACHPDDFGTLFEKISEDILSATHSAHATTTVWYRTEKNLNEEQSADILSRLSEIQLFVVPVTQSLLNDRGACLDFEIAYAKEHNIPVLPLLSDTALIPEYSLPENFGDLQFLNPNDPDTTALPYSKKLEDFLSSVLVGDELRKKVQAAFDAYIFLSYRKKDRLYAQELMRLIHKNDFCRDIAIWYDEFLTPGEDFNKAISAALEESKLFALVVTPHIIEPDNYVLAHEYPMAETAKKPIVALESVATDRKELEKHFNNLPECTDVHDQIQLSDALLQNLKTVARSESKDSPEHNYLIGLAYLNGIDVETDHEKAKALIEGAAESGLPDAMLELAGMYKTGKGVKQDHREIIKWLKKAADVYESLSQTDSDEYYSKYTNTLYYLAAHYMTVADNKRAKESLERLIELFRTSLERSPDDDTIGMTFNAYLMLATVAVNLYTENNPSATQTDIMKFALGYHSKTEEFINEYSDRLRNIEWMHPFIDAFYSQLSSCYLYSGQLDKATEYKKNLSKFGVADNETQDSAQSFLEQLVSGNYDMTTIVERLYKMLDDIEEQLKSASKDERPEVCATVLIATYGLVPAILGFGNYNQNTDSSVKDWMRRYVSLVSQFDCNAATNDAVLALASVYYHYSKMELEDGNIEKATELCKQSLQLGKLAFDRYADEEPLKTVILATSALDQLRGDGKLDPEAWRCVEKCYNTIFSENYKRIQNFEFADTYYFSMIIVSEQENDLEKAKDYAKARQHLSFVKSKESGNFDDDLKLCENIYATCNYMYRTEEFEKTDDYLSLVIDHCAQILNKAQEYKLTKEKYDRIGVLLCKSEYLLAAVYSELDREDEAEKELGLFLDAAQHFKHCPELENEIAIAEEIMSDDDEDEED